jgi:hypothetical protein
MVEAKNGCLFGPKALGALYGRLSSDYYVPNPRGYWSVNSGTGAGF